MKSFSDNKKATRNSQEKSAKLLHCRSATLIAMLPATLLSGCMGIYEGGFECPAGIGVGCKSISEVNDMVNQGVLPKDSSHPLMQARPEIWYAPRFRNQEIGVKHKDSSDKPQIKPLSKRELLIDA